MKIHKKIGLGLVLITSLFAGLFFSHTSSAAPSFSATWIDRSNIKVTGEGKTVILNDKQWDDTWQYLGNIDGCDTSTLNGFGGSLIVGFSDNSAHTGSSAWSDSVSNAGSLVVKYKATATDTSCTTAEIKDIHINNWQNARISYRWTDTSHTSIARIDRASDWTFDNPVNITSGFDAGKTRFFLQSEAGDKCQDVIDVSADKSTMWLYEQIDRHTGTTSNTKSPVDPTQCWLKSTINDLYPGSADIDSWNERIPSDYAISLEEADAVPQPTPSGASTKTGSVTGDDEACYSSNWALSWLACPVITTAQTLANKMYEFVENQLKFRVEDGNQADSLGDPQTKKDVKGAWNNFRILVSGLVVILMLVMVIGQAIGTGLFDAYTVKKMLPRLVMGVIMIQLSWPIFSFVINFADDLGRGLADIIYAPFGGADALNLKEVMAPYADSSKDGQTALLFSWFTFLGGVVTLVVAPFLVLGAILTILVAIFVAFLTLLFRKILIILALILVPVALIAWMMPNEGLRRYWKIWWDNFLKALMMFPLIILIIAGGRIFAKIGSGQSDLVGFFIVLVGFFGPLFILPKTFKWGGTAMQLAGNAMTKAQTASLKKPKEALQGFNERYQGKHAKEYSPLTGRATRALRRIQSGHFLPTERSRRLTIAAGDKWANERNDEALAFATRSQEKALAGYNKFDVNGQGEYVRFARNAAGKLIDAAGNEVGDESQAHILQTFGAGKAGRKAALAAGEGVGYKKLTGVEAGKQALIDIAGNDGDSVTSKRAAQAAVKQLIDTHSEIELQKSRIQGGKNAGRRASEVYAWRDTITNSPPHYSAINTTRPDLAPDVIETAQSRTGGVRYEDATLAQRKQIDIARLHEALDRLTPEQMQQAHYGLYQDIAKTEDVGLSQKLADKITYFDQHAGVIGANAVGSLRGGREPHVDRALAAVGTDLHTLVP